MDANTLSNEQMAFVAARTFGKLWLPRGSRESLQPFQAFCYELLRSTQIAVPIVMLTLLYVNKFKQRFPALHGGSGSEYRMFVVALMLASKYLEDNTFTTKTWSEVSHLPAKELTIMQREFLVALNHKLHVTETEYNAWITQLQTIVLGGTKCASAAGITLAASQPVDMGSPADLQVVPSPISTQLHEAPSMDFLPSPAKRMRPEPTPAKAYPTFYASGAHGGSALRARPAVEPLSIPALPAVLPTPMYTPPLSSGSSFANAEFTFSVPSVPAAPQPTMLYPHQQQHQHRPLFSSADLGYSASVASLPTLNVPASQPSYPSLQQGPFAAVLPPLSAEIYSGNCIGITQGSFFDAAAAKASAAAAPLKQARASSGFAHYAALHHQQQPSAAAAAAAALAVQYPAMYFNTPTFGLGNAGMTSTYPIYTYGA